jgi:hypothetical protein
MIRPAVLLTVVLALALPCLGQASARSTSPANSIPIPANQGIVARLTTNLDAGKGKQGDVVEAETTRDIKEGHEMLLKKGSTLTGHIAKVQASEGSSSPSMVVILFDGVTPKGGQPGTLNVLIGALAPEPTVSTDTLQDGRGLQATNINSTVTGGKNLGSGGELMATSSGVFGIPGMSLATTSDKGMQYSVIQSTAGDVKLKKGTQIVFKAPEQ